MTFLFSEFFFLLLYAVVASVLALVIFSFSVLFAERQNDPEKLSPYECGFDPFEDARNEFDVRFYLVALLFLVFDIEASFLFPWAYCLSDISSIGFWVMIDFFFELVIGFVYVWKVGALEWD